MASDRSRRLLAGLQLAVRAAFAAGLSVTIAERLSLAFPLYSMIAAVIVSDLSPAQTRRLGLPRLAGTGIGALLGAALSGWLPHGAWASAAGILSAMTLSPLVSLPGAARVAGYVCGIVLLVPVANPWSYAFYRMVETALGIGIAVLVSIVPKAIRVDT